MPNIEQQQPAFQFGVFEINPHTRELRKHGVKLKLQDQPLQILLLLLEHPGEIVTRDEIQKRLWPENTYVDFDNAINSAVRKLRDALGDSPENPRFVETLARRGYRFIAPVSRPANVPFRDGPSHLLSQPGKASVSRSRPVAQKRHLVWIACSLAVVMGGTGMAFRWWISKSNPAPRETPRPAVPLTGLPGYEVFPSFSPEGTRVAFSWYEPGKRDPGVYVKLIGPGDPIRLTASRDGDFGPAWSPDGLTIAFLRARGADQAAVVVIPAVGGAEKEITVTRLEGRDVLRSLINSPGAQAPFLVWSGDARWLLAPECEHLGSCAIVRLSVDGGEKRRVTFPPNGHSDGTFAVSPDGKTLAFTRTAAMLSREIYTLTVSDDMAPAGEPKQLTFDSREIEGLSWTPDGKRLVFSSTRAGRLELWQMTVAPPGKPIRITAAGEEPTYVAVSREGHHLVYSHFYRDTNIWRMAISGQSTGQTANFIASTRIESEPKYSPDGKRIAFESSRTGNDEIWISKEDGSDPVQVTSFGAWSGSPRWSPDGGRIAFDSNVAGDWNIYVADSQRGKPVRLTMSPQDEMRPSWSHDGKWIYYSSIRAGRSQIFKMPSNGGAETQITKNGGFAAFESADSETLYYGTVGGGVAAIPLHGGSETILSRSIYWLNFAPGRHGVYFIEGSSDSAKLNFLDCRTLSARSIAAIPAPLGLGGEMAVSPDEAWMLYERIDRVGSELMLIENFR